MRGGTCGVFLTKLHAIEISIHPPREGWDARLIDLIVEDCKISIHPPREGWDIGEVSKPADLTISIHPPREGWDRRR